MPPNVLVQTLRTIQTVAPDVFKVHFHKYYGDGRRQISVAGERTTTGNLTKTHEFFDSREENAYTNVICSYQTWNERHGPKGQNKWLQNKRRMSAEQIKDQQGILYPRWPGTLPRCFECGICDEARELKSLHTKGNATLFFSTFVFKHEPCQCTSSIKRSRLMIPPSTTNDTGIRMQDLVSPFPPKVDIQANSTNGDDVFHSLDSGPRAWVGGTSTKCAPHRV